MQFTATKIISTTQITEENENNHISDTKNDNFSKLYTWTSIDIVVGCALIGIAWLVDAKCFRKNDVYSLMSIIVFTVYCMDFISDLFFALNVVSLLSTKYWFIFVGAVVFLIVPEILNLLQLRRAILQWFVDKENGLYIIKYTTEKSKIVYLLAFIVGSGFAAVKMLNSGLFKFKMFSMGLKRHQMEEFQNQRLFSIVIFENIPQIILQAIYLNIDGNFGGIALMALLFSVFSVIISIFEVSTKRYASKQQLTECIYGEIETS